MQRVPLLVLVGLLTLGLGPAGGQVAARQGVAPPPEDVSFESPMVLELPLPNVERLQPDSQVKLAEVRKYVCDKDVRIYNLTLGKQYKGPRKARSLDLVLSGSVWVEESYDRRVDITLGIKVGEEVLVSRTIRNQEAEERRVTPFRIVVPMDEAKLLAAYAAEPPPSLEVTLTVRDDS